MRSVRRDLTMLAITTLALTGCGAAETDDPPASEADAATDADDEGADDPGSDRDTSTGSGY